MLTSDIKKCKVHVRTPRLLLLSKVDVRVTGLLCLKETYCHRKGFRSAFGRGSTPPLDQDAAGSGDTAKTVVLPTADELLQRLGEVHTAAMTEIAAITDGQALLDPVDMPYAVYPIKLGAILFCPLHEHIHCGQIGILRRMLGLPPIR